MSEHQNARQFNELVPFNAPGAAQPATPDAPRTDPYRILSLTGGGMMGVIGAAHLKCLEEEGQAKYGPSYRLSQSYDLIIGTSTGAVQAAGLALGMTADDIGGFYLRDAKVGFVKRRLRFAGLTPMIDETKLRGYFEGATKGRTMHRSDLATDLAITVKSLTDGRPHVVTSLVHPAHGQMQVLSATVSSMPLPMTDVLMASTAVAGILPPHPLRLDPMPDAGDHMCIDGGFSPFNDPSHLGYRLARRHCPHRPVDLTILGAGTGPGYTASDQVARMAPWRLTLKAFRGMVVDTVMDTRATMRDLHRDPSEPLSLTEYDMAVTDETFQLLGKVVSREDLRRMRDFLSPDGKQDLYDAAYACARKVIKAPLPLVR